MARRNYSNTAVATTLSADLNSTASSFTVSGTVTGYPSTNAVLTLDKDQPNEERVLYTTRSGSSFTGVTRGYDGTAAASHSSGAAVEHTITAADVDEPNNLVNLADAAGDILVASAADTWSRLPVGAANLFLVSDPAQSLKVKWAAQEVAAPNSPLGTLGFARVTTSQTGIGSTVTDLTGLALTVTVGTSRRVRITGHGTISPKGSPGLIVGSIYEGATELDRWIVSQSVVVDGFDQAEGSAVVSPSAGSHTYKLTLQKVTGGGTVDLPATATAPSWIAVEDIGNS